MREGIEFTNVEELYKQISQFTKGMAVTRDKFELIVPKCHLQDLEWNHMDQMHRHAIHNTYEKNIRVTYGRDFAVSLTQWGKWPLFISVSDAYVDRGLFYQTLTIAGIIVLHSIISMEEITGTNSIRLTDEWFIATHKIFGFLHKFLNNKLHKLNTRLQQEDEQLRQGRFALREKGYTFKTDVPDYYNSNKRSNNTIYPILGNDATISITDITKEPSKHKVGNLEFILKKTDDTYLIWPAACPHEGGPLLGGKFCDAQVTCPWHGLSFRAVELSASKPMGALFGFEYFLHDNQISIKQLSVTTLLDTEQLEITA